MTTNGIEARMTASSTPVAVATPTRPSKAAYWTGHVLSGLATLFLLFDAALKVIKPAPVVEGSADLGYPESTILGIGLTLLICTVLYMIPRTAVLGAVLLTGFLGGAIATHVRVENPLFTHTLFPTYVAALVWGGLYLRENRLRTLLPLRRW